jgi:hypothetical protein
MLKNLVQLDDSEFNAMTELFLHRLNSPIEVLFFAPPGMPVPNYLIQANLNFSDIESYKTWLESLNKMPKQAITWNGDINEQGETQLILSQKMPLFTKYDLSTQTFYAMGGLTVQADTLSMTLSKLSNPSSPDFFDLEQKTDTSAEGLFLYLQTKAFMPLLLMQTPPQQRKIYQDWGLDSISHLSLGWGVSQNTPKIMFAVKTAKEGLRALVPQNSGEFDFSARGKVSYFAGVNFPFHDSYKAFTSYFSKQSKETASKILEMEENIKNAVGYSLDELLSTFGSEVSILSDEHGPLLALELSDKEKFYTILKSFPSSFETKLEKKNFQGKDIYHFSSKNISFLNIENQTGSENVFLKALTRIKQHYYWMEEGNYLILANIPQLLIDRIQNTDKVSIKSWLSESQGLKTDDSLITMSTEVENMPSLIYGNYLNVIQTLSDLSGHEVDLFSLPSPNQLNLPDRGAYSLQLTRSTNTLALEICFENSPIDFLYSSDQSSLTTISVIAIAAGLVLPQLGKAQEAANRAVSNNHIKSLCATVIAETGMTKGAYYKDPWLAENGIRTATENEPALFYLNNQAVYETKAGFEFFSNLKGAHPWGGYYVFHGTDRDGNSKQKLQSDSRIILEIYPPGNGDGKIAIGFADGHVVGFDMPNRTLSADEIKLILSVRGGQSLFPEK